MLFDITQYNNDDFNATYSAEDNKLRLHCDVRIDEEHWAIMKKNGWKWAPVQELFFCFWSVDNEDFCLALAGDILPEELTLVERAEAKADRLLILAKKRSNQCVGYQKAANDLMNRLNHDQPILIGHSSQRKAEQVNKKIDRAINKAEETGSAVTYWVWRAQGVISTANHKNAPRTIFNRIKKLSKELRDNQRVINEAARMISVITKVKNNSSGEQREKNISYLCGDYSVSKFNLNEKIRNAELTPEEALNELTTIYQSTISNVRRARIINHILNRLSYEQNQLALVPIFNGELSPAIIQTFLRAHGADKPSVTKSDYGWLAVSGVCLPLHIHSSSELELDEQEWRELMQSVGYEVPAKRAVSSKPPILNFKTDKTFTYNRGYQPTQLEQVGQTKAEYKANGSDFNCTHLSECKTFRFRVGFVKNEKGGHDWKAVFITDSKAHETPDSMKTPMLEEA